MGETLCTVKLQQVLCVCLLSTFFKSPPPPPRHPASRSGNIPGRVKRVVSCKRKTHHLTVARRKQTGNGRSSDAANKENAANCTQGVPQQMLDTNPWDLHVKVSKKHSAAETSSGQDDCSTLTEVGHTLTAPHCCCVLNVSAVIFKKNFFYMFSSSLRTITH